MKELKNVQLDRIEDNEIDCMADSTDTERIALYEIGKRMVFAEHLASGSNYYMLTVTEKAAAIKDTGEWLKDQLDWLDDDLERLSWGVVSLDDLETEDKDGDCYAIIVLRHFYASTVQTSQNPHYAHDEGWNTLLFDSYAGAKSWIEKAESETYYLQHGEFCRPDYVIVEG